jgi:imidazolonepropionase-like amidohydrolase
MCLLAAALIAVPLFFIFPSHLMAQQPSLVIRNISVIDGLSPEIQPNRTVVIVGNRIKAIGEKGKVAIPKRAKVIYGRGKYLIPGLWDSHVHLNSPDSLPVFVANGITGVREMGGDFAVVKDLRDRVSTGKILGPRIKIAGPILESERWMKWATGNAKKDNDTGMLDILSKRIAITDPEQARETVRKLAELGVDLIKVRNTHSADAFLAILSEAKKFNLPVAAHAPRMNLSTASDGGLKSIEHVESVAALRGNVKWVRSCFVRLIRDLSPPSS